MKKELNLQMDTSLELLQNIAFKSLEGIKVSEVVELRRILLADEHEFFNLIKLKYILHLGLLGLEYKITTEVERVLFGYINYLLHELPVDSWDENDKLSFSMNYLT